MNCRDKKDFFISLAVIKKTFVS